MSYIKKLDVGNIKLNNNVVITSGEGTQINPYVVED